MQKETLKSAIEKSYLGGLTEIIKVVVKNKTAVINFTPTEDKSVVGKITINNTDLADAEIGIFNTTQLLKLIKILDHTITLTFNKEHGVFNKIILQDNKYDLEYYLADMGMIPKTPKVKEPEIWDLEYKLDTEFIKKYTDAKKALGDIKQFTIESKENQLTLVVGEKTNFSNKVKFNIPLDKPLNLPPIPFSALNFNEILLTNDEAKEGKLSLSKEGLMKLEFKEKDIESVYWMVRLE